VRLIWEELQTWEQPVTIAILPDHPTPCALRTHTSDPVPFVIYRPGQSPDEVETYDELSCQKGAYGTLKGNDFMYAVVDMNFIREYYQKLKNKIKEFRSK
jgi:2,3-bisphosphoglycerate-independent phosphoglycerate mutase